MSFWKYLAPTAVDTISSCLDKLPADPPSSPLSAADLALYHSTLDALLVTSDLLSEIKSGSNQRLNDFLAMECTVLRLGGWVVWGLGRDRVDQVPNGGIIGDDVEDGKVPDFVVQAAEPTKVGMGGVPRRRNMDEMGVLEGGTPETEEEKAWSVYVVCSLLCSMRSRSAQQAFAPAWSSHCASLTLSHRPASPGSAQRSSPPTRLASPMSSSTTTSLPPSPTPAQHR